MRKTLRAVVPPVHPRRRRAVRSVGGKARDASSALWSFDIVEFLLRSV